MNDNNVLYILLYAYRTIIMYRWMQINPTIASHYFCCYCCNEIYVADIGVHSLNHDDGVRSQSDCNAKNETNKSYL